MEKDKEVLLPEGEDYIFGKEAILEEDIKIIEEFKKNGYSMLLMKYGDRNKTNLKLERALQNLLTKYKQLKQENNNFKEASIINDRLYKEVCNKNKELEEENKKLIAQKIAINNKRKELEEELEGFRNGKYISLKVNELYIPKSLIKRIIENHYPDVAIQKIIELLRRGETMQIGDKVKITRKRIRGEIYYDEKANTRAATVVEKYKNFVVVQYEKRI